MIPGLKVETVESSCCGMAGSFGYEAEHFEMSMKMAELSSAARGAEVEAGSLDRGRWHELPPSDSRRDRPRSAACGAGLADGTAEVIAAGTMWRR